MIGSAIDSECTTDTAGVGESDAPRTGPNGVPIVLVERGGTDFDLDHVVLRLPDRDGALTELEA